MQELIFRLSVVFTKEDLNPYSPNEKINEALLNHFGAVASNSDLNIAIGEIWEVVNFNEVIEIPEDFEVNDLRHQQVHGVFV